MSNSPPRLGKVQLQIMQVIWKHGKVTARQITEELGKTDNIAHSTVQTLLRKMEVKGAITHELDDRTFVFRALYQQNNVKDTAIQDILQRVFGGSVYGLVSQLLKRETIQPDEMRRLRELIKNAEDKTHADEQERGEG